MNLIIDIGNNSTKYFLFKGKNILLHGRHSNVSFDFVREYVRQYEVKKVIVSSVVELDSIQKKSIDEACPYVIWLDISTPLPLKIKYRTPGTLGTDRIAAAVGAKNEAPGHNLMIIDAGSAITIDVVDAQGNFLGGNISPGIKMRLTALHEQTSRLPLVEKEGETPKIGKDTETAIRSGVIRGICHEIEGYIAEMRELFPELLVFLTGGDEKILTDNIKSCIFADKFLTAKGLNQILENLPLTQRNTEKNTKTETMTGIMGT